MKKYIVWLDKIGGKNMRALGGKALNLCQLRKIGVPVPLAFCLSTEAYRERIKDEKVQKELNELLRAHTAKNKAELVRIACSLREAIINTEIPEEVRREVLKSYHKLEVRRRAGELSCAVRSSATAEDLAGASFAGQYDTFLNVKEEEGLLLSIKKCWASFWTERAILYRERKGFKPSAEALAVIVQEMILSEQSGVVFTINPISGNKGEMLIEATWGLGESLVSGNVTPDNYIVDKATLEIKKKNINDKKLMSILDFKSEGTLEIEVPSERRRKQVLSDDKIKELANLASVIEEHYGEPQDIEWACHNGRFHILQSRPITTVKSVPKEIVQDKNDGTIWTTANVGEVVPGVVTPLTWSLMMEPIGGDNFIGS